MNRHPVVVITRSYGAHLALVTLLALTTDLAAQSSALEQKGTPAGTTAPSRQPPAKDSMMGMPAMKPSSDMHGSMNRMMTSMEAMKMSGDTDRDFAMMMKVHHQGAIDMAEVEIKSGRDPKLRAMAKRIIEAQQKEIKDFDRLLETHK